MANNSENPIHQQLIETVKEKLQSDKTPHKDIKIEELPSWVMKNYINYVDSNDCSTKEHIYKFRYWGLMPPKYNTLTHDSTLSQKRNIAKYKWISKKKKLEKMYLLTEKKKKQLNQKLQELQSEMDSLEKKISAPSYGEPVILHMTEKEYLKQSSLSL